MPEPKYLFLQNYLKELIQQEILRQFEEQWSEYECILNEAGFIRTRKHSLLEAHVRWVFKRACLKQSWQEIANEEHAHRDTIRKAVIPIINLLGLKSPKLRGGHPRK